MRCQLGLVREPPICLVLHVWAKPVSLGCLDGGEPSGTLRTDRAGGPGRGICRLPTSFGVLCGSDLKPGKAHGGDQVLQGRCGLWNMQKCSHDGVPCGLALCGGAARGPWSTQGTVIGGGCAQESTLGHRWSPA